MGKVQETNSGNLGIEAILHYFQELNITEQMTLINPRKPSVNSPDLSQNDADQVELNITELNELEPGETAYVSTGYQVWKVTCEQNGNDRNRGFSIKQIYGPPSEFPETHGSPIHAGSEVEGCIGYYKDGKFIPLNANYLFRTLKTIQKSSVNTLQLIQLLSIEAGEAMIELVLPPTSIYIDVSDLITLHQELIQKIEELVREVYKTQDSNIEATISFTGNMPKQRINENYYVKNIAYFTWLLREKRITKDNIHDVKGLIAAMTPEEKNKAEVELGNFDIAGIHNTTEVPIEYYRNLTPEQTSQLIKNITEGIGSPLALLVNPNLQTPEDIERLILKYVEGGLGLGTSQLTWEYGTASESDISLAYQGIIPISRLGHTRFDESDKIKVNLHGEGRVKWVYGDDGSGNLIPHLLIENMSPASTDIIHRIFAEQMWHVAQVQFFAEIFGAEQDNVVKRQILRYRFNLNQNKFSDIELDLMFGTGNNDESHRRVLEAIINGEEVIEFEKGRNPIDIYELRHIRDILILEHMEQSNTFHINTSNLLRALIALEDDELSEEQKPFYKALKTKRNL